MCVVNLKMYCRIHWNVAYLEVFFKKIHFTESPTKGISAMKEDLSFCRQVPYLPE